MNSRLCNISAILVAVLTVSVGIFVYNSSQATITDSMTTLSTQEIDTFNNQFSSYEGYQTGSNVKALMGKLISNVHTYRDEIGKVPQVYIDKLSTLNAYEQEATFYEDGDFQDYIDTLGIIRNSVETKHEYYIEITYQEDGLVDYIHISYDSSNPMTDLKYRN